VSPARSVIVWFRQDLRLADNPALAAAVASGAAIVPLYLWSPDEEGGWAPGAASRWWLHRSLEQLATRLAAKGSRLILRQGRADAVLQQLARETQSSAVYWNRRYEPAAASVEAALRTSLPAAGITAHSFQSALLREPWTMQTQTGGSYQVFTPYWRSFLQQVRVATPSPSPTAVKPPAQWPASLPLDDLGLLPRQPWHESLAQHWQPGEIAGRERLLAFGRNALGEYATARDRPDLAGTSRLSPYLHHGEVSPRQVWAAIGKASERMGESAEQWTQGRFIAELVWREYAAHVLHHHPTLPEQSRNAVFERLAWREDPQAFAAWTRGHTGHALVDAGMRELWATGWMHNRVRMVAGSLLVKNLLLPWQQGERWFWDTLVDADLASNALNWQWVAGTGPDAAPFFRIFNPDTQAEKFDPAGDYRRRWVPEAGTARYLQPIVDLKSSRQRALDAYRASRAPR
jgi:deoxyribodipyrimidine photo-lyase